MHKTIGEIARIVGGELHGGADIDAVCLSLLTDSRSFISHVGTVFCAIRTESSDGHRYIADMIRAGVRTFIVERVPTAEGRPSDAAFIKVPSVERAVEAIGCAIRDEYAGTLIAVTGSAGKTVVKEMLYSALLKSGGVHRSPRSWNSRLGVPLTLAEMPADTRTAIVEVGIDTVGDMEHHASMLRPDIGILTTITAEHDAGFVSRREKILEKLRLFQSCPTLVYDASDESVARLVGESYHGRAIGVRGISPDEVDRALASAVLAELGCAVSAPYEPVSSRLDVHEGVNDCMMIYDGFTHDYRTLVSALDFMRRRTVASRTSTVILSDLVRPATEDPEVLYRRVAALLVAHGVTRLIAVGPELSAHRPLLDAVPVVECVADAESFMRDYDINRFSSETILISGEPRNAFREIKDRLESPRHDTIFEINLDSVVHNFNYYRSLLRPHTGVVAMVKASAYGTGAPGIAKTLQAQGAAYLAVAVVDEGVELRRSGITMPIMVLNPITTNYKALFDNCLEPSVFSLRELEILCREAARCGVEGFSVHVKLDTGMHRVGFVEDELTSLIERLDKSPELRVVSVFSHLATADCLDMDDYTESQLKAFDRMSSRIQDGLPYPVKRHLLNTAGIMRYPDYQYDMVRLGIGLYGVSPVPCGAQNLRPVASLRSTIISVKQWPAGTTIGYSRRGVLTRASVIATVPIGYADGVDRHLGCGAASFVVRGVKCPTVGNICMDQCMIDITDVPSATIGDTVEIFGAENPVEGLADILGTIPYELLTSVSPRVKRIYYRE